jgi:hypothetical protein
MVLVSVRRTEMATEVNGALGLHKCHRYIPPGEIWAGTVHTTSPEITVWTNSPQQLWQLFQSLDHLLHAIILNLKVALTWWHRDKLTDTRLNSWALGQNITVNDKENYNCRLSGHISSGHQRNTIFCTSLRRIRTPLFTKSWVSGSSRIALLSFFARLQTKKLRTLKLTQNIYIIVFVLPSRCFK